MNKKLTAKEYLILASLLFGLWFGAGNLIFPVSMGQMAGSNSLMAAIGFCITGVGLPLAGIAAIGLSQSEGLFEAGKKVGPWFSYFFTCALYLSIGPLFAIPRTATVSFTTGIMPFVKEGSEGISLFIFSLIFFALVLFFSLRPSKIMTWVGKFINPTFLVFLFLLILISMIRPIGNLADIPVDPTYSKYAFFKGFLDGYGTMDGLASLAFAIIVINAIRSLGVKDPKDLAKTTVKSGVLAIILMAIIYIFLTIAGAQSSLINGISENGGVGLEQLARYYYGGAGNIILAFIMVLACLKTAIGLITACASAFEDMFPRTLTYRQYAIGFTLVSFVISNFGLNKILEISVPALYFLYPVTIVLIGLLLFGKYFDNSKLVNNMAIIFTMFAALLDVFSEEKYGLIKNSFISPILKAYKNLPLGELKLSWIFFSILGLLIGIILMKVRIRTNKANE